MQQLAECMQQLADCMQQLTECLQQLPSACYSWSSAWNSWQEEGEIAEEYHTCLTPYRAKPGTSDMFHRWIG
jgi:hypothetical protein